VGRYIEKSAPPVFSMYIFLVNRAELVCMIDSAVSDSTFGTKPHDSEQEYVVKTEKLVDGHEFHGVPRKMYIEKTEA